MRLVPLQMVGFDDIGLVVKSRLASGAYKAIKDMTPKERTALRSSLVGRRGSTDYTIRPKNNAAVDNHQLGVSMSEMRRFSGENSKFHTRNIGGLLYGGAASTHGSKRGLKRTLHRNKIMERANIGNRVIAHEAEHLRPKRPSSRLAQIMNDPKRLAREEARADWFSGNARYDRALRSKTSAYSQLARRSSKGKTVPVQRPGIPDPRKFAPAYKEMQDTFRDKNIKFGARQKSNEKWIKDNFGQKQASSAPVIAGVGAAAAGLGASGINDAKKRHQSKRNRSSR